MALARLAPQQSNPSLPFFIENNMDDKRQNDYASRLKEFKAKFPNYKEAEPVECLNLIMRKEFAKQILEGKKKLEFRGYTDHYISRLYDNDVLKFMQLHKNEPEVLAMCEPLRMVEKIHFHNYNDTWYLDVECTMNEVVGVTDADVEFLHSEYDCHELDDVLQQQNAINSEQRPMYFYFVIGKVIDTNLK